MFSFNGLSAQVTISGSVTTSPALNQPTSSQTVKVWSGATTNATVTIDTVGAGKIWYITGIHLYGLTAAGCQITINVGTAAATKASYAYVQNESSTLSHSNIANFNTPLKLVAGDIIQYVATNTTGWYVITGYEVSA